MITNQRKPNIPESQVKTLSKSGGKLRKNSKSIKIKKLKTKSNHKPKKKLTLTERLALRVIFGEPNEIDKTRWLQITQLTGIAKEDVMSFPKERVVPMYEMEIEEYEEEEAKPGLGFEIEVNNVNVDMMKYNKTKSEAESKPSEERIPEVKEVKQGTPPELETREIQAEQSQPNIKKTKKKRVVNPIYKPEFWEAQKNRKMPLYHISGYVNLNLASQNRWVGALPEEGNAALESWNQDTVKNFAPRGYGPGYQPRDFRFDNQGNISYMCTEIE